VFTHGDNLQKIEGKENQSRYHTNDYSSGDITIQAKRHSSCQVSWHLHAVEGPVRVGYSAAGSFRLQCHHSCLCTDLLSVPEEVGVWLTIPWYKTDSEEQEQEQSLLLFNK
jgi:hypothetical protein